MPPPTILAVFGPTGVGKTALAIALAERLRERGDRPVAVSADALQVYAGLEILTGVATAAERARLEHRLVSFVPVDARFSVAEHARLAHAEIDGLLAEGRTPIVVGGTGLYLRAALADLDLRPAAPDEIRAGWMSVLHRDGAGALHAELGRRAPWAAAGVDPNDAHRLVRLLELSDLGELEPPDAARPNQLWTEHTRRPTRLIGVTMDREALYARIDARVDAMVAAGAVEEVRRANAAGASETARKALGFDDLLTGDVDAMKRRTRNYAKRQLTWMRKLPGVELVDLTQTSPETAAARMLGTGGSG
jgi:tRNA dimethylallyltransferase